MLIAPFFCCFQRAGRVGQSTIDCHFRVAELVAITHVRTLAVSVTNGIYTVGLCRTAAHSHHVMFFVKHMHSLALQDSYTLTLSYARRRLFASILRVFTCKVHASSGSMRAHEPLPAHPPAPITSLIARAKLRSSSGSCSHALTASLSRMLQTRLLSAPSITHSLNQNANSPRSYRLRPLCDTTSPKSGILLH